MTENAKHSLDMEISGLDGNIGDRKLHFEIQIPSDNMELASLGWYAHLGRLICGSDEQKEPLGSALDRILKGKW